MRQKKRTRKLREELKDRTNPTISSYYSLCSCVKATYVVPHGYSKVLGSKGCDGDNCLGAAHPVRVSH